MTPETLRINSQTPVFLNRTIFDGLTVSKMASVFIASLHGSTRAILSENSPFITTDTEANKTRPVSASRAGFTAAKDHVNKPGRTAREAYLLYCIHTLKTAFHGLGHAL